MKYNFSKIFREEHNDYTTIVVEYYDLDKDYYDLIASQANLGRKQLILNTKLLMYLMEKLIINYKFKIDDIEFVDNGIESHFSINQAVELVNQNNIYFHLLKDSLKTLINEDSIEISKIQLSNKDTDTLIQSNGILKCNITSYDSFPEVIKKLLEAKLNG